ALETRTAWQRLRHVTLPLLRPFLALAVFLSFTTAFADLANVWMLTGGRVIFPVIGTYAYWLGIRHGAIGEAAAWSLSLVPVLAGTLAVTLACAVLAAYALGRLQPPGWRWWRRLLFATYVVPNTILFIPIYQVVLRLGLDDTPSALVLIYSAMALPFCVWVLS